MNHGDEVRMAAALERISLVLGALYAAQLGKVDQVEKAERLHRCGFSASDIAGLLGTTSNAVNIALHRARKVSRKTSSNKKK